MPVMAWGVAGLAVLVVIVVLVLAGRHKASTPATIQPLAPYAANLPLSNNEAMPPQIETLPLSLIRTREPYVDTQPVSGAPLKPGDERDFRLIFESLPANWNMQMPEIRIIQVDTK